MRMIDADKLKQNLLKNYVFVGFKELLKDFFEAIDAQPTVNQWIPTSERLPDKEGLYRVTIHPDYVRYGEIQVEDFHWKNGKWMYLDWCDFKLYEAEDTVVIAWKPLEEPYRE